MVEPSPSLWSAPATRWHSPGHPPRSRHAYGVIVVDHPAGRVLLRQPSDDPTGRLWTFAHGLPLPDESPVTVAASEGRDQFGCELDIIAPIPSWFCNRHGAKWFFLARALRPTSSGPNWETSVTRWFDWESAAAAIAAAPVTVETDGDGHVLAVARVHAHSMFHVQGGPPYG